MGSKYERSPGRWVLRVYAGYDDRGRQIYRSRTFRGTERQARRALARFQAEVDDNRHPQATASGTVGELLEDYYANHAWRSSGAKRKCREDLDTYLIPHLGPIKLLRFDDKPIEMLYKGLRASGKGCLAARGQPLADSTIRRIDKTLRAALNWGVKKKRIGWNPATAVDVPAEPAVRIVVPGPEEIPTILAHAQPKDFAAFVRVAVATGRRREDILGLRVTDVKTVGEQALVFDERVVLQKKEAVFTANQRRILEALAEPIVDERGGAARLLAEKTGHRTVPALTRGLFDLDGKGLVAREVKGRGTYRIEATEAGRAILETADAQERASGVLVEPLDKNRRAVRASIDEETMAAVLAQVEHLRDRAKTLGTRLRTDAFVFSDDPEGAHPWRPDSTSRKFGRLMDKLQMPYTLHSLRHFHVTELLTGGMDVETVAGRVGDDPRTIYKVYSHFRRAADTRAPAIIGAVLNRKPQGPAPELVQ